MTPSGAAPWPLRRIAPADPSRGPAGERHTFSAALLGLPEDAASSAAPAAAGLADLARLRYAARFPAHSPIWDGGSAASWPGDVSRPDELTLCPQALLPAPRMLPALAAARRGLPQAVLRLEWWAALGPLPGLDAAALQALAGRAAAPAPGAAPAPLYVHPILTHEEDLTPGVRAQLAALGRAGVPMAGEVLLLNRRNGDVDTLRALLRALEEAGVRPYYLLAGAWLPAELRVEHGRALDLERGLRGWISGLAVPQLVREAADGTRAPLIPAYLTRMDETGVDLADFRGLPRSYPNPKEPDA